MKYLQDRSGISLIFATVFVAAFMLVIADLAKVQLQVQKTIREWELHGQTRELVWGAAEWGGSWARRKGVGWNSGDVTEPNELEAMMKPLTDMVANLGYSCTDCIKFEVKGRATGGSGGTQDERVKLDGADYFSVPIRGTGTAGKDCRLLSVEDAANADNPCNWDRIAFNEAVEIPLYYEDSDGAIQRLSGAPGEDFKLRIRTPLCSDVGLECASGETRVELWPRVDSTDYLNVDKDPTVIQWLMYDSGGEGVLSAWDKVTDGKRSDYSFDLNTEIYSGRINKSREDMTNPFLILDMYSKGKSGSDARIISDFLTDANARPTLGLKLIQHPQQYADQPEDRKNIPYLEYQVLSKGMPISNSKSLVIGTVSLNNFNKKKVSIYRRPMSNSNFALSNF